MQLVATLAQAKVEVAAACSCIGAQNCVLMQWQHMALETAANKQQTAQLLRWALHMVNYAFQRQTQTSSSSSTKVQVQSQPATMCCPNTCLQTNLRYSKQRWLGPAANNLHLQKPSLEPRWGRSRVWPLLKSCPAAAQ